MLKERQTSELYQWRVHLVNIILVGFTFFVKLARGSIAEPSIFGLDHCGGPSWLIFSGFFITLTCWTFY